MVLSIAYCFFLYLVLDENNARQAEGHKASFCLEDSKCEKGVKKFFNCSNGGDQGVSVNCADNYKWNIDCQWIDVSDVKYGKYKLRIVINPLRKIVESDYSNNIAVCNIEFISQSKVNVTHCQIGESFFLSRHKNIYSTPNCRYFLSKLVSQKPQNQSHCKKQSHKVPTSFF